MNAQLEVKLLKSKREPVRLAPIAWGKPDKTLARGLCDHIADATPSIVLRFNPFNHRRVRTFLRTHAIDY